MSILMHDCTKVNILFVKNYSAFNHPIKVFRVAPNLQKWIMQCELHLLIQIYKVCTLVNSALLLRLINSVSFGSRFHMFYPRIVEEIWQQGISVIYMSAHSSLCSNQLLDFFLLHKSNVTNDGPK
jgi:hypothetical protein